MLKSIEKRHILTIDEVLQNRPSWVRRQISNAEARSLASEVIRSRAERIAEIGTASGFSSAVLLAAARHNTEAPSLFAFDLNEKCYFNGEYNTGAALAEMLGDAEGFHLTTGVTSADVTLPPELDFAFIDANHSHPWPSLDLLSLSRNLKQGAIVALHDVDIIFGSADWSRKLNGPRDLFRAWKGEKWIARDAPNLAYIRFDAGHLELSLASSLSLDWDTPLAVEQIRTFISIADELGKGDQLGKIIWDSYLVAVSAT